MSVIETITLPSRGIIYDNCPEEVQVQPFVTKAYKDLLASNGSDEGMNNFIDSCLVNCPVKAKDLHAQDRLAILFKMRSITLGDNLQTQVRCTQCNNIETINWSLSETEVDYLYADEYPIPVHLPESGKDIKIRFITDSILNTADREAKKRASLFNKPVDEFKALFRAVSPISVDGMDIVDRANWYSNLHPRDAIYLDQVFSSVSDVFGLRLEKAFSCSKCGKHFITMLDSTYDFFRADKFEFKASIRSSKGTLGSYNPESVDAE